MTHAELQEILVEHAKWLRGEEGGTRANLRDANLRGADLSGADLRDADLGDADLRRANLRGANLRDADLRRADLSGADLRDADLGDADLRRADLSGADIPVVENLHTKISAMIEADQFDMNDWHGKNTCGTTHCHAGSAIHLAGDAGYALEQKLGSPVAGALIINASCPYLEGKVPDFYTDNVSAKKFIRDCAAKEKEQAAS